MSRSVPNPVASIFLARMTRNIVAMVRFRSFGDTRDNIDCREQRVQSSGNLDNRVCCVVSVPLHDLTSTACGELKNILRSQYHWVEVTNGVRLVVQGLLFSSQSRA